ncbi:hypothetical protein ABZ372_47100, partial [Streptomyces sp. NPDC005921]
MRRVVCLEFGDPSALRILEEPTPRPRPGEVLVELTPIVPAPRTATRRIWLVSVIAFPCPVEVWCG